MKCCAKIKIGTPLFLYLVPKYGGKLCISIKNDKNQHPMQTQYLPDINLANGYKF